MIEYNLIRSKRKTISIIVGRDGTVTVRAPLRIKQGDVDRFVISKTDWIEKKLKEVLEAKEEAESLDYLGPEEIGMLKKQAEQYIPERVEYYSKIVGVSYGKVSIRCQKRRWGSCSSKGDLSFNCLLMLLPREVCDSVIVHELCHRKHMDHSAAFYLEVRRVMPEYDENTAVLKKRGSAILARYEKTVGK